MAWYVLIRIYDRIKNLRYLYVEGMFHGIFMGFHFLAPIVWADVAWHRIRYIVLWLLFSFVGCGIAVVLAVSFVTRGKQ